MSVQLQLLRPGLYLSCCAIGCLCAGEVLVQTAACRAEDAPAAASADQAAGHVPAANDDAQQPETHLLGMTIVRNDEGQPLVKEVYPTSPAWDSGVREGDVLVEFDGVKPKQDDNWWDAIGTIAQDKDQGETIFVVIQRKDAKLELRIAAQGRPEKPPAEEGIPGTAPVEGRGGANPFDLPREPSAGVGGAGPTTGATEPGMGVPVGEPGYREPGYVEPAYPYGVGVPAVAGVAAGPEETDMTQRRSTEASGALTPEEQRQLEELERLREQGTLSPQQVRQLQQLRKLQDQGSDDQGLSSNEQAQLRSLQHLRDNDTISVDQQNQLQELERKQYLTSRPPRSMYSEQIWEMQHLQQLQAQNALSPEQAQELQRLEQLSQQNAGRDLTPAQRLQLQQLLGHDWSTPLSVPQQQRLQDLQSRSGELSPQERAELGRMLQQQDQSMMDSVGAEHRQLMERQQTGRLSPQELNRLQQLNQQRRSLGWPTPGPNQPNDPTQGMLRTPSQPATPPAATGNGTAGASGGATGNGATGGQSGGASGGASGGGTSGGGSGS
jgi:PDZ domain